MVSFIRPTIMRRVEFKVILDRMVAIKTYKQESNKPEEGCDHSVLREIVNIQRMRHKNVLEILNVHYNQSQEGSKYFLVFPYYEYDLHQYLKLQEDGDESFKELKYYQCMNNVQS